MTIQLAFILFVVVALAGWGIAELKNKTVKFEHSEIEKEEAAEIDAVRESDDYKEPDLHDLLKHNSTKGYNAVD